MLVSEKQLVAKILVLFILTVFFPYVIFAQQNEPLRKNKPMMHDMTRNQQMRMHHRINTHDGLLKNSNSNHPANVSDLTEFQKVPYQYPDIYYWEVAPVTLSNGNLMMFCVSTDDLNGKHDTLYCTTSTDGGETWGERKTLEYSPYGTIWFMTALKTNSGRIIVFWASGYNDPIKLKYSDDNGVAWSSVNTLPASPYISEVLSASQAADSTLYISYSRDISGTYSYFDIVFRTSTDNGLTWSAEKNISNDQSYQYMCNIIPDTGYGLLAVYTKNSTIVKRVSSDGGNAWSTETTILDNPNSYEYNPRVVRINNDSLCIVYMHIKGIEIDLYYSFSGDNGNTWSTPIQFTRFVGYEGYPPGICLFNHKPFVVFASDRWQSIYNIPQAWYGIIGITEDDNPPPAVLYSAAYQYYFEPGKEETILANIGDESGVQDVLVNISLNGGAEYSLQMFDDGQHNDWGAGDGIYGIPVGLFSLGDQLDYNFSVTDVDNNSINVHGFTVDVVQHGNPINPNKGFEQTPVGIISADIDGWGFWKAPQAAAVFEIVDDIVKEGNHALKNKVTTLGENDWDILAINQPYSLEPNVPYRYQVWAKADKDSTFVDFTLGEVEGAFFSEWLTAYNVRITTEWQEYSFNFFPQLNTGRSRISFSLDANSTSLPINFYIDDLRIVKLGSTVDVENNSAEIPSEFSLSQNYPNPFNPSTKISYSIPHKSFVTVKVYDPLGSIVSELVSEEKEAGKYEIDFNASDLSSGVYFYKIEAGGFIQIKKMILIK